ncbi:MAG: hypothetical protein EAZ84_12785 [Verrucomicrobia bacterium]|nr:MAG: hypothetical protein EAZ84_12785 [Verrucomicrobiota bacterium]TAE86354.1 MAG: hypothetical protein EAZ82_11305 [Verrucomicrobiota bacterium]TAF24360.1 MAG: hypothetical protein EAZ71_10845 [Verrucomicrobiota bacterium]
MSKPTILRIMRSKLVALVLVSPCLADSVAEIPLGIEVVTGYRSSYIQRGFELGNDLIDIQAEAEIALTDHWILNLGGNHGSGENEFSENAGFLALRYETDTWSAGIATTGRDFTNAIFRDGLEVVPGLTWHLSSDWDLAAEFAYDAGDGGWYSSIEAAWSKPLGESSFLSACAGSSCTADYYGSDGWHDAYGRLSWTYVFNRSVSITPFVGTSIPTSSGPTANQGFAGLWFEVNF